MIYTRNIKKALRGLSKEVIGSESGKNSRHMSDMFFLLFGKDNDVIQIKHKINIKKIIKNIIDKILKRGTRIGESKWHNQVLITVIFSSEFCQMLITLLDSEKVICTTKINLGEDRRTIKDNKKPIHRRNTILVTPSDSIEFAVINTQTEATIPLFEK
ncbi:hypothetical protein O181_013734 [Austropuccinia psidii MF-1]|uniref:Uncharacterized protein n=1 Tax=Austropuccinia psidii MF-1 TaxID=1389203 RepID=A0A9Q3BYU8_9BASI|nr:hypothetical protein [Austropuccinia psidii MF-1]